MARGSQKGMIVRARFALTTLFLFGLAASAGACKTRPVATNAAVGHASKSDPPATDPAESLAPPPSPAASPKGSGTSEQAKNPLEGYSPDDLIG